MATNMDLQSTEDLFDSLIEEYKNPNPTHSKTILNEIWNRILSEHKFCVSAKFVIINHFIDMIDAINKYFKEIDSTRFQLCKSDCHPTVYEAVILHFQAHGYKIDSLPQGVNISY